MYSTLFTFLSDEISTGQFMNWVSVCGFCGSHVIKCPAPQTMFQSCELIMLKV